MTIEILKIYPIEKDSALKATVNIKVNDVTINKIKIIQVEGKDAFCTMPSEKYTDREGKTKYSAFVYLERGLMDEVTAKVLKAWRGKAESKQEEDDGSEPF